MSKHGFGESPNVAECARCRQVEGDYPVHHTCANLFVLHTQRDILYGKQRTSYLDRDDGKLILRKFRKIAAALRNTDGGVLIVHVEGQHKGDRYLAYFDDFVEKTFHDLIQDGQLYINTFSRGWLSDLGHFRQYSDFIFITIRATKKFVTVDYKTKVCTDVKTQSPSVSEVVYLLTKTSLHDTSRPVIRGIEDVQELHQCRNIQLKSFKPNKGPDDPTGDIQSIVHYIWSDLRLKEYIASLSKVSGGGSIFVGVTEKALGEPGERYETKLPVTVGFELPKDVETSQLQEALSQKVKSSICVLNKEYTFTDAPKDLISIAFHPVPQQKYVLEVAIRCVNGIVFYDKEGPETYTIQEGVVRRMDKLEWLSRIKDKQT